MRGELVSVLAPQRHRFFVLFNGRPIASAQSLSGAQAYLELATRIGRPELAHAGAWQYFDTTPTVTVSP